MISDILYNICKLYFMLLWVWFVMALLNGNVELFGYITGVISLIFLGTNIKWWLTPK